jgi:hypothetical protein
MIDNVGGISGGIGKPKLGEHHDYVIEFNDNKIYGENAADDCPADGSYCKKFDKTGFTNALFLKDGKDLHLITESPNPMEKVKSYTLWGGRVILNRN